MNNLLTQMSPMNTYYLAISLLAFIAIGLDKWKSVRKKWRISEEILIGFAILGGALGTLTGMIVFRHKIRKPLFYLGVPLLYLLHRAVVMPLITRWLIETGFMW